MPAMTFAQQVRQRRAENKISQFDLAVKAGLGHGIISRLERTGNCSLKKAVVIARALGMTAIPVD